MIIFVHLFFKRRTFPVFDLLISIAWSREDLMMLISSVVKDDHTSVVDREQRNSFWSEYPAKFEVQKCRFLKQKLKNGGQEGVEGPLTFS